MGIKARKSKAQSALTTRVVEETWHSIGESVDFAVAFSLTQRRVKHYSLPFTKPYTLVLPKVGLSLPGVRPDWNDLAIKESELHKVQIDGERLIVDCDGLRLTTPDVEDRNVGIYRSFVVETMTSKPLPALLATFQRLTVKRARQWEDNQVLPIRYWRLHNAALAQFGFENSWWQDWRGVWCGELGAVTWQFAREQGNPGLFDFVFPEKGEARVFATSLVNEAEGKFWDVQLIETELITQQGRRGRDGRTSSQSYDTAEAARLALDELMREKRAAGYEENIGEAAPQFDYDQAQQRRIAQQQVEHVFVALRPHIIGYHYSDSHRQSLAELLPLYRVSKETAFALGSATLLIIVDGKVAYEIELEQDTVFTRDAYDEMKLLLDKHVLDWTRQNDVDEFFDWLESEREIEAAGTYRLGQSIAAHSLLPLPAAVAVANTGAVNELGVVVIGDGPHQVGGVAPAGFTCPVEIDDTPLVYVARIERTPPLAWLPFETLHVVVPLFSSFPCLYLDYTVPMSPTIINHGDVRAETTELLPGKDNFVEYEALAIDVRTHGGAASLPQVGYVGVPQWLQRVEQPRCPKTDAPMQFVIQLSEHHPMPKLARHNLTPAQVGHVEPMPFYESGECYVFIAPESRTVAIVLQGS